MKEIVHPPVDLDLLPTNDLHQTFAQEAAILLMDCCVEQEEIIANKLVTTHVTERIDMESTTGGLTVALRLRNLPVVECENFDHENARQSDDYLVVALEHAVYDDTEDEPDDETMEWQPYVLAVINAADLDDAQVLSTATGRLLEDQELFTAQILLTRLREELRVARYEESDLVEYLGVSVRKLTYGVDYQSFESGNFIDTNPCTEPCANDHAGCLHSPYSLN